MRSKSMARVFISNVNLLAFWNALQVTLNGADKMPPRFQLALVRNSKRIEVDVRTVDEMIRYQLPAFRDFEEAATEVLKSYARKDDKGEPVMNGPNFEIPEEVRALCQAAIEELRSRPEYALSIKAQTDYRKSIDTGVLQDDAEHDLALVSIDEIPEGGIETRVFNNLSYMFVEMQEDLQALHQAKVKAAADKLAAADKSAKDATANANRDFEDVLAAEHPN